MLDIDQPQEPKPSYDAVVAWLALKTGKSLATQKRLVGLWAKSHGVPAVLEAFKIAQEANPVHPVGYMGAILAGQGKPPAELGAITPARAATPIQTEPPAWMQTRQISMVRDQILTEWREDNADRITGLSESARWHAEMIAQRKAWILAQEQLRDTIRRAVRLSDEDWQTAIDRSESQR